MFQINYKGLKRRESYDEIVQLIANGGGKISYPNRSATQIANSPYMKQLDAETMLDLQDDTLRSQKEKLKQMVINEIASQSNIPRVILQARAQTAKSEKAVLTAQRNLQDVAVGDDDIEDFRSAVGEELAEHEKRRVEKLAAASRLVTGSLEGVHVTPVKVFAKATQIAFEQSQPRESGAGHVMYAQRNEELRKQHEEQQQRIRELEKENYRLQHRTRDKEYGRSSASSSGAAVSNLMGMFSGVATGIGGLLHPTSYQSPEKKGGSYDSAVSRTPIDTLLLEKRSKSHDSIAKKSSSVKQSNSPESIAKKSMKSSKSQTVGSGMASPVRPASRTPSGYIPVKTEPTSSSSKSGMAPVVRHNSRSRSQGPRSSEGSQGYDISSPVPLSGGGSSSRLSLIHISEPTRPY